MSKNEKSTTIFTTNNKFKGVNISISAPVNVTIREPVRPYDEVGASYYIIAVMVVYGLAVVLLIAYISKRSIKAQNVEHDERQVNYYLQKVSDLRESNARQQFKELKSNIETLVNNKAIPEENTEKDVGVVNIANINGTEIIIDNNDYLPSRKISQTSNNVIVRLPVIQTAADGSIIKQADVNDEDADDLDKNRQNILIKTDSEHAKSSFIIHQPHFGNIIYYQARPDSSPLKKEKQPYHERPVKTKVKSLPHMHVSEVKPLAININDVNEAIDTDCLESLVPQRMQRIEEMEDENLLPSHEDGKNNLEHQSIPDYNSAFEHWNVIHHPNSRMETENKPDYIIRGPKYKQLYKNFMEGNNTKSSCGVTRCSQLGRISSNYCIPSSNAINGRSLGDGDSETSVYTTTTEAIFHKPKLDSDKISETDTSLEENLVSAYTYQFSGGAAKISPVYKKKSSKRSQKSLELKDVETKSTRRAPKSFKRVVSSNTNVCMYCGHLTCNGACVISKNGFGGSDTLSPFSDSE